MRNPGFGWVYINDFAGEERLVRIGTLDIEDIKSQYGHDGEKCYMRTNDGFCQSGWTSGETAGEILAKIAKHDKEYVRYVRDFAERNNIILMRGELW